MANDDAAPYRDMQSGGACAASATSMPKSASTGASASNLQPKLPVTLPHLDLQGQMSIKLAAFDKQAAQGISLGFFFSGTAQTGQLDLMTLMGSQMAQVNWSPGQAWLTNDKGKQRYDDIDALSLAALGEQLPLQTLIYWMQGQPDPDLPSQAGRAPDTFEQVGWTIDTRELRVKKLLAQRPGTTTQRGVVIKVYLDR